MKLKNLISIISIFFSINSYSQTTEMTSNDIIKIIDLQLSIISEKSELQNDFNLKEISEYVDKNRDDLAELKRISKELKMIAGAKVGTICVC
jgi:hypothetical protein